MRRRSHPLVFGLVVLLSTVGLPAPTQAIGGEAADFTLRDIDGQQVTLSDHLEGHVVVLHFWTACCASGKAVMPHLKTLYGELNESGVSVLAVSVDAARNEPQVKAFARAGGYSFPVLLDQSTEVVTTYNPRKVVPFTVVIDKDGQISATFEAYSPGDETRIREAVAALLESDQVSN